MQIINKFNKEIRFLLCVIDIFSKCAWVTNTFQKILKEYNRKPNKILVYKGSEYYMKSW